jgi:8-oxo-dGTP diphosphatase
MKKKYKHAIVAVDMIIFTIQENDLMVLLVKMKKHPFFKGMWAAPGGLIKPNESLDKAALRELYEKTGIKDVYLEQLYTFGDPKRDPLGRVISVAYFALINARGIKLKTTKKYSDIKWFSVKNLPKLAYDHKEIIDYALLRLHWKLEYTNVAYSLLPRYFTFSQLQKVYEIILNKKLDKRNFRRRMLFLNIVKPTQMRERGEPHRPARLYTFVHRKPEIISR